MLPHHDQAAVSHCAQMSSSWSLDPTSAAVGLAAAPVVYAVLQLLRRSNRAAVDNSPRNLKVKIAADTGTSFRKSLALQLVHRAPFATRRWSSLAAARGWDSHWQSSFCRWATPSSSRPVMPGAAQRRRPRLADRHPDAVVRSFAADVGGWPSRLCLRCASWPPLQSATWWM